jgi:hypothetical protein
MNGTHSIPIVCALKLRISSDHVSEDLLTILSLDITRLATDPPGTERRTHNNQMTLEPVLHPRSVTMCPRMES